MKQLTILMMIILLFGWVLVSCEDPDDGGDDVVIVDPCQETPNCIPDMSDWKLHYKPMHSNCTECHTACLPSHESFCAVDDTWVVEARACIRCHRRIHK